MCKTNIVELIETNNAVVEKAILELYKKQTASEKNSEATFEKNNAGFNAVDAPLLSSFAEWILSGRHLTEKQLHWGRKMVKKYSGQLLECEEELIALKDTVVSSPEPLVKAASNTSKIELINGKIRVKTQYNDYELRDKCKNEAKLSWKKDGMYWEGPDNAINRVLLGIPLPECKVKSLDTAEYKMLRDYQRNDVEKMISYGSCLNANEMGLGKTLETLISLQYRYVERVLIVVPLTLIDNWIDELLKWNICDISDITPITGSVSKRMKALNDMRRFVIINYDLIASKQDKFKIEQNQVLKSLQGVQWDIIIADEAHRIKNRKAQRSMGLESLSADLRVALTGTPVQNRPDDLWNILHWINPFYSSSSYWKFVEAFCELEDNGYGIKVKGLTKDLNKIEMLNTILDSVMIRNEKETVLKDLPKKMYQPVHLQMTDKQAKLYQKVKEEILFELSDGSEMAIPNALTRLIRLQQVTSNPEMFDIKDNPKFDTALEMIQDNDTKFVVFSRFEKTISAFEKKLQAAGIKCVKVTGEVENRSEVIKEFKNDSEVKVFLGTIGAAGEGINGLQDVCSRAIFFDREWSPAKNAQAEDRLHRIGQLGCTQIIDLVMKNTIDTWVEKVLTKKLDDIKELIR